MSVRLIKLALHKPPFERIYDSGTAATETVPNGATSVLIELWGPGGDGADGAPDPGQGGNGGGSGGYCSRTAACAAGDTLTYTVGTNDPTATTVTGTLTGGGSINMTANSGVDGGAGGTASGGTTNTTGNAGSSGTSDPSIGGAGGNAPNGGVGGSGGIGAGDPGGNPGGGGGGSGSTGLPGNGASGRVKFTYS